MKTHRFFLMFWMLMLASCLETEDPDGCNYIDTNQITVISIISTTQVKVVKAYAGDSILCESISELLFRKNKDEQFYHYSCNEEKINPEHEDWFLKLGCYIKHNASSFEDKHIVFQIWKNDVRKELDIDSLLIGKKHVFAIAEQDTAWLFGYGSSLLVDSNQDYNFSISTRMGCHDGYCFVSLPITEKVLCDER